MNLRGRNRLPLKLRIMSDEDLWWLFLHHRKECSREFWEEVENRKAAGTLFQRSPFWTVSNLAGYLQPQVPGITHAARFSMSDSGNRDLPAERNRSAARS